jgi:cytidylate kinase
MTNPSPIVIAIDGPSASGKGTVARRLAEYYGFAHLDTGLLYRAVGMAVVRSGGNIGDAGLAERAALALAASITGERTSIDFSRIDFVQLLQDDALRSDEASVAASKVALVPGVRAALLNFQKNFCASPPNAKRGAVLDGRDIGTVIAPDAKVKIFVTASAEARATRRFKELQERGQNATYASVLEDMKDRDARDAQRSISPTLPAPDAVVIDTTDLTAKQAFAEASRIADMILATSL